MPQVKKLPIPNISEIVNADGTLNDMAVVAGILHHQTQKAAGHLEVTDVEATQTDLGPSKQFPGKRMVKRQVSLISHE